MYDNAPLNAVDGLRPCALRIKAHKCVESVLPFA